MSVSLVLAESVQRAIVTLRGHRVMLDEELAKLYRVTTGNLNLAVRRNAKRFPADFMFQLTEDEAGLLLQTARAKKRGGRRSLPYVFTEQHVAMLSSVLRSERAVLVNVEIMRVFVQLRQMLIANADLARKLAALEENYDKQFSVVFEAIRQLMTEQDDPKKKPQRIGFKLP